MRILVSNLLSPAVTEMAYLTRALVHHIQPVDTSRNKRIKLKIEKLKNTKITKTQLLGVQKSEIKKESWKKLVKAWQKVGKNGKSCNTESRIFLYLARWLFDGGRRHFALLERA